MDPSHPPNMTLSIGGLGLNTENSPVDAEAKLSKLSQGLRQSPWWVATNDNSLGLKRKRGHSEIVPRTETSTLSFENSRASSRPSLGLGSSSPSLSPCNSGFSTGSRTSTGTMSMRGSANEGPSMSLGLGLTIPAVSQSLENGCAISSMSGGRSMLTSLDTPVCQYANMSLEPGNGASVLLGLGPSHHQSIIFEGAGAARKGLKAAKTSIFGSDLGVQLELGLSRTSMAVSDDEHISCMSLGQGNDANTRVGTINELNLAMDDEGSTSARTIKVGGYIPSLVMGHMCDGAAHDDTQTNAQPERDLLHQVYNSKLGSSFTDQEKNMGDFLINRKALSVITTTTSGPSANAERLIAKTCKFRGCGKGARGASGLCITHGGGRRCQRQGCNKGAEGRTVYCKSHGGGRRCQSLGCTKSAEGKTDYCIGHGGGRRCSQDGCNKAARGQSGLCIRHGGGKRCQKEGCTKSAEGYSGLCISHGGGRRCQAEGCKKGAQGSTLFCKAHGGGKRCMIQGCTKGAEGSTPLCKGHGGGKRCMFDGGGICTKSVHGGTSFCVAHGGGKRCIAEGCTKSARGKTSFCVRHGGGKRCKFDNCSKSAQGSTDFCKAHGGGKRCSWGQEGSPYTEFVKDESEELFKGPCDRFARGKLGLCAAHSALVQDRRVHGVGTMVSVLPAGIGPGLFRGLVAGLAHKGNDHESASDASNQPTHGSKEHTEHISESGESGSIQKAAMSISSEDEGGSMEDNSCPVQQGLPQPLLGYNQGFTLLRTNVNVRFKEAESLSRMKGNVFIPNNGVTGLWPGSGSHRKSKESHGKGGVHNLFAASFLIPSKVPEVPVVHQPMGEGAVFRKPLLPPQVLVPLWMQKGEFPPYEKGSVKHTKIPNAGDSGIVNTHILDERVHGGSRTHEERVHGGSISEGRVHGGGFLALLSENSCRRIS